MARPAELWHISELASPEGVGGVWPGFVEAVVCVSMVRRCGPREL